MNLESDKIVSKKYTIFVILGILLISLLIAGGTYAYLFFGVEITNKNVIGSTTCFNVIYDEDNGNDGTPINGMLLPSSVPSGGLSGKITIGMDADCNIDSYGNFYLNIDTGSDILFQPVGPHCENSQTLRTLFDYTEQATCEAQSNGKWVTNGTALKYAIYTTGTVTSTSIPIKTGYISTDGTSTIYENFVISNYHGSNSAVDTVTDYYVYIWLDGNLSDNSYANQSIVGDISATVSQVLS